MVIIRTTSVKVSWIRKPIIDNLQPCEYSCKLNNINEKMLFKQCDNVCCITLVCYRNAVSL